MKKLLYVLLLLPLLLSGQRGGEMLIVSQYQAVPAPLYTNADAANPVNETNSVAGWTDESNTLTTSVNSIESTDGSLSIQFDHSVTTQAEQKKVAFTVEPNTSYTILVDAKRVVGSGWEMWLRNTLGWSTNVGTVLSTGAVGSWGSDNSVTGTTGAGVTTAYIRIGTTSSGAVNWQLLLDNIRITKN